MCAGAECKIGEDLAKIYFGYEGGSLSVGKYSYGVDCNGNIEFGVRYEMYKVLDTYTKEQIITMILDFIENVDD
jgi:hypothetical protein